MVSHTYHERWTPGAEQPFVNHQPFEGSARFHSRRRDNNTFMDSSHSFVLAGKPHEHLQP